MAVLRALGSDCSGYLGKTFVLPQCDARGQGFLWPSCVHLALTAPPILEKLSSCHSAMLTSPYLSRSCLVVVMVHGSPVLVFGNAVPDTSPKWSSAGKKCSQHACQGADGHEFLWPRVRSSGGVATPRSRSSWGIIA